MQRLAFLFTFFILFSGKAFSQKETNIWYFGYGAGVDFNSGSPVAITTGVINTNEGTATICDKTGQLLFYSDGNTVWNKNHLPMQNGTNIAQPWFNLTGTWSSTQAALIVPLPGSSTIYYLFTTESAEITGRRFMYSIIDMSLQSGLGEVVSKSNVLSAGINERACAVAHKNGTDTWIIYNQGFSFYSLLLSSSGLSSGPVLSSSGPGLSARGYLKASPNGKKIAAASESAAVLYDFNSATGVLSNPVILTAVTNYVYSAEFSPDSKKLYVNKRYPAEIWQYDLSETDILNSATKIGESSYEYGAFQTGPDGKIYVASENNPYLDVIANPNSKGLLSDYRKDRVFLKNRTCALGLPNQLSSLLSTQIIWSAQCPGEPMLFSIADTSGVLSVRWNFGDSTSNSNTSTLINPGHVFSAPGNYTVSLILNYQSKIDTVTTIISDDNMNSGCNLCSYGSNISNVFTPNGDGVNDEFIINEQCKSNLLIYDRWGVLIYSSDMNYKEWDGRTTSGVECPPGVYFYSLTYEEDKVSRGFVQLIR